MVKDVVRLVLLVLQLILKLCEPRGFRQECNHNELKANNMELKKIALI